MTVAIIGAAGFVGNRLHKRFLRNGTKYKIYDKKTTSNRELNLMDVTDIDSMNELAHYECIINLAAEHRDDIYPVSRYDDTNVQGAINVCNIASKNGINKIIFTSSVAIYGFATAGTDETGEPNYFNDYGRTKYLAELVYKEWQAEDPKNRTLIIVRPTVIFGEGNRGNVYNLLNQVASGKFAMFGNGKNIKSMAYVENVAAFLEYSLTFEAGLHIYNYIDKPDLKIRKLIEISRKYMNLRSKPIVTVPYFLAIIGGYFFDFLSFLLRKNLSISSIRIKKFCSDSQFNSSVSKTGFQPRFSLEDAIEKTVKYEFIDKKNEEITFISE